MIITVDQYSGGYRARCGKFRATSTSGPNHAAQACAAKAYGVRVPQILVTPEQPVRNDTGYPVYPCGTYTAKLL
jgi:hypothetical protein